MTRVRTRLFTAALTFAVALGGAAVVSAPARAVTPDAPTGLGPEAGAALDEVPAFSWNRVPGATSYDVQVSTSDTFSTTVTTVSATANDHWTPLVQVPPGTDYWRVRANASSSVHSDWTTSSFVRNGAPAITLHPVGDGTLAQPDEPPVLSWDAVPGVTSYAIQVSTDPNFTDPSAISSYSTDTTSYVSTTLSKPATYYWRVQGTYTTGLVTAWQSDPGSYVISGLQKPTLVSPTEGQSVDDVALDWNPVPGAATYDLQVSTDINFNSASLVDNKTGLTSTRYSPTSTYDNDQYYWRVRPVDASGNALDWSQVDVRTFQRAWADQPNLINPSAGDDVTGDFYYQWSGTHLASSYTVQLSTSPSMANPASCPSDLTTLVPARNSNCFPKPGVLSYWRVIATDGGPSSSSGPMSQAINAEVHSFVYDPPVPEALTPVDGETVTVPVLHWAPQPGADKYNVVVTNVDNGKTTKITTGTDWFTPHAALDAGTYRWSVQSVSDGQAGSTLSSAAQPTFTVGAAPVGSASTPTSLTVTGDGGQRFPHLSWDPVAGATGYTVYYRPSGTTATFDTTSTFAYPAGEDESTTVPNPGTYEWYVEATNGSTVVGDSQHSQFTIAPPPMVDTSSYRAALAGQDLSGSAGSTYCDAVGTPCQNLRSTPVLSWTAPSADVSHYMLYLSHDAEMTNLVDGYPVSVDQTTWAPTETLPDSQAGSAYYWEVAPCVASNCLGLRAAVNSFNKLSNAVVPTSPLSTMTATDPLDTESDDVTLTWDDLLATSTGAAAPNVPNDPHPTTLTTKAQVEARYYTVQVATNPAFQSPHTYQVDQPWFTLSTDTYAEGPVYWRVQGVDGSGNPMAWSDSVIVPGTAQRQPGVFLKASPAPTLDPADSDRLAHGDQRLSWEPLTFAKSYDLEIYKNDDTLAASADRVLTASTQQRTYTVTSPLPASATAYAWRVRRSDAKGRTGAWSDWGEFMVTGESPVLDAPSPGAQNLPAPEVVFSWEPVQDAAKYKVEWQVPGASSASSGTTVALSFAPTAPLPGGAGQWRVTAYDGKGGVLGTSSWSPYTVKNAPTAATPPMISGTAATGSDLTASAPEWDVTGVVDSYQWLRDGKNISKATAPVYTVQSADVGHQLSVRVTGAVPGYANGTATSDAVTAALGPTLIAKSRPWVAGTWRVGGLLTAHAGTWPAVATTFGYQWLRGSTAIGGATRSTYTLTAADAGHQIRVRVEANATGYTSGTSTSLVRTVPTMRTSTTARLATSSVKGRARGLLNVQVTAVGTSTPTGQIQVMEGSRIRARSTLTVSRGGRLSLRLPTLPVGNHRLVVRYLGSSTTAPSASRTVTLSVKR